MNKTIKFLIFLVLIFYLNTSMTVALYDEPNEFGNLSDTTVWVGGTAGIVNATGNISTQDSFCFYNDTHIDCVGAWSEIESNLSAYYNKTEVDTRIEGNVTDNLTSQQIIMNQDFELYDWFNTIQSAGRISGGQITENGGLSVHIEAGNGLVKTLSGSPADGEQCETDGSCASISETIYVDWAAQDLTLVDNAYNYIYYDYETGLIKTTTDFYLVDFTREFTIGRAYVQDGDVTIRLCGTNLWNFPRRVQLFGEEVFPIVRATGMEIGETGTRHITITNGILWAELLNRFTTDSIDTSAGDNFTEWYYNGTGWESVIDQTQINNTKYNDITSGLNELTPNRYAVHWVYMVHDSTVHIVYGQGDYTLAQAEIAQPPATLPGLVESYATLIGRILIQKNSDSFAAIESAFTTSFSPSTVTNHNDLNGLQGGTGGEYFHLNSEDYNNIDTDSNTSLTNLTVNKIGFKNSSGIVDILMTVVEVLGFSNYLEVDGQFSASESIASPTLTSTSLLNIFGNMLFYSDDYMSTVSVQYDETLDGLNFGSTINQNGNEILDNTTAYTQTVSDSRYWNEDGDYGLSGYYTGDYIINTTNSSYFRDIYFYDNESTITSQIYYDEELDFLMFTNNLYSDNNIYASNLSYAENVLALNNLSSLNHLSINGSVIYDSSTGLFTKDGELICDESDNCDIYYTKSEIEGNFTNYYTSTEVDALPVSTFTNDAGYLTSYTETDPVWTADKSDYKTVGSVTDTKYCTYTLATDEITCTAEGGSSGSSVWVEDGSDIYYDDGMVVINSTSTIALNVDGRINSSSVTSEDIEVSNSFVLPVGVDKWATE